MPDAISWGDMRIAAVIDWAGEVPEAIGLLPGTSRTDWEQHQGWLSRIGLWDPATNRRALSVHSWVLQTDGMTVVVDTGAGNGKDRPGQPLFAGLSTLYLENLARSGVQPEDVDIVINTHLHADHVGWNTRSHDGHWVPRSRTPGMFSPVRMWSTGILRPAIHLGRRGRTATSSRTACARSSTVDRPIYGQALIRSGGG